MKILFVVASITVALCPLFSTAQVAGKGKVLDAVTGNPLPGASISVGATVVSSSDKAGDFTIDCNGSQEIMITFIGYEAQHKKIKCGEDFTVRLNPESLLLSQVEITATSNPNKQLLYQPASIAKLSEVEINRGTGIFLDDAINTSIPGVTMQRRTVGAGQQFNIRGYGNGVRGTNGINSNFDGQGYKVYLNGIPVTDAEGITLMDDIDFGSVGNVEVLKGPSGTLFGLAIAGVVNLKTVKPPKGQTSIGQDITGGSYGLQRYTTRFQTAGEKSSLLVNYGHQKSDGFMSHTNSRKDFVNFIGEFQPNEKQSISTYFGYSNSYDERGGELTIDQYHNHDYTGNPEYIKRNAHSAVISYRAGIGHTYTFNSHLANTTTLFGTGLTSNVSSAGGWTDKNPVNLGLRSTLDVKLPLQNGFNLSGISGVETQHQYAQVLGYNMVANPADANAYWIIGAMRSNQATVSGTTSLFTEWTLSMPQDFSLVAGIGYSKMKIELNDKFYVANSTKPTRYAKTYGDLFSPHIALNKIFSKQVSAYVSYSTGYKAPVSSYFFIPTTGKLNTGLKPEMGTQFEIGTKGAILNDKLVYELALFDALFKDKMYAVAVPLDGSTTTTAYSYIANGGRQDNKGIEAQLKYSLLQSGAGFFSLVRPFANITYSDFKYKDYKFQTLNPARTDVIITDYDGKAVAGVARVTANVGVDVFTKAGLYGNMYYSYKDGMPITSDGLNKTSGYNLLNGKIGFRHSLGYHFDFDVFFGVNNITGTQYYYMVFVNQLPDAYLPAPSKANYFGGINLNFNF